tara:strand:+ start:3304 stop:3876 length:573 start_codon:yes stop_codon:yes gene_type:complete
LKTKKIIAGVDEVGRGCLAGPVVSAAVILRGNCDLSQLRDSKKISFKNRVRLSNYIKKNSYYGIGIASVSEIVKFNILQATLISMKRAIKNLGKKPNYFFIDGIFAPKGVKNCKTIIRGDSKIKCISAASILAKVYRDNLMIKLSKVHKHYELSKNFGYGTKRHLELLKEHGITSIHRKSFKPIHNMLLK